jgi:hypothetical protein
VQIGYATRSCEALRYRKQLKPLTPNDLQRRRAVSPLKIKIPGKNMREKPTSKPIKLLI